MFFFLFLQSSAGFDTIKNLYSLFALFGAVLTLLGTLGSVAYFFFRLFNEHKIMRKQQEAIVKEQETQHNEIRTLVETYRKEAEQERRTLATNLETLRLRDKDEAGQQFGRIFETLTAMNTSITQCNTSNQHILKSLTSMEERIFEILKNK